MYYSIQSQLCSFSSCAQVVNKIRLGLGWDQGTKKCILLYKLITAPL